MAKKPAKKEARAAKKPATKTAKPAKKVAKVVKPVKAAKPAPKAVKAAKKPAAKAVKPAAKLAPSPGPKKTVKPAPAVAKPVAKAAAPKAAPKKETAKEAVAVEPVTKKEKKLKLDKTNLSDDQIKWHELQDKYSSVKAPTYSISGQFEAKSPIQHKIFGWGYILSNEYDRLEVLFEDGKRMLISNRKLS